VQEQTCGEIWLKRFNLGKHIKILRKEGNLIKELLRINYPLVGLGFVETSPFGLSKLRGKMEFCKMWNVAFEGKSFFALPTNHNCLTGQYYLGLRQWKESACRFLVDKVHAFSPEVVKRYLEKTPILPGDKSKVICISPLDNITFIPDIILVRCTPEQAMLLLWSYSYRTGEIINGETGTAMCISLAIKPYLDRKPSFSIGDPGSRYLIGLSEQEIVVSIPFQLFGPMVETLQSRLKDWKG